MLNLFTITKYRRVSGKILRKTTRACWKYVIIKKTGQLNDTFVVEIDQHRLVYFSEQTRVSLEFPEKQVRDTLFGLHKLPLACDIKTDHVFWPAKQTVTISIDLNDTSVLGSSSLPIISVNKTSKVHKSLKELLAKLPKEDDPFTIDFDYYGLTLEKMQSYSIYAQSITTIIVVLNSFLIGYLLIKNYITKNRLITPLVTLIWETNLGRFEIV